MKATLLVPLFACVLGAPAGLLAFDLGSAVEAASSATQTSSGSASSTSESSSLISTLTDSLGITSTQATGGVTAMLSEAKSNLSSSDYSSLLSSVPSLSSLSESASSATSLLGSSSSSTSLTDQFSALGMDSETMSKFTTIVLDYVKSSGGSSAMSLLQSGLGL